jgi:hypothetical protein
MICHYSKIRHLVMLRALCFLFLQDQPRAPNPFFSLYLPARGFTAILVKSDVAKAAEAQPKP